MFPLPSLQSELASGRQKMSKACAIIYVRDAFLSNQLIKYKVQRHKWNIFRKDCRTLHSHVFCGPAQALDGNMRKYLKMFKSINYAAQKHFCHSRSEVLDPVRVCYYKRKQSVEPPSPFSFDTFSMFKLCCVGTHENLNKYSMVKFYEYLFPLVKYKQIIFI